MKLLAIKHNTPTLRDSRVSQKMLNTYKENPNVHPPEVMCSLCMRWQQIKKTKQWIWALIRVSVIKKKFLYPAIISLDWEWGVGVSLSTWGDGKCSSTITHNLTISSSLFSSSFQFRKLKASLCSTDTLCYQQFQTISVTTTNRLRSL